MQKEILLGDYCLNIIKNGTPFCIGTAYLHYKNLRGVILSVLLSGFRKIRPYNTNHQLIFVYDFCLIINITNKYKTISLTISYI